MLILEKNFHINQIEQIIKYLIPHINESSIIYLYGDLGSGKSTVSYEIIKEIEGKNTICSSPTFTIMNEYEKIVHVDLYRLKSMEDVAHTGLLNINNKILLIEWPEIMENQIEHSIKSDLKIFMSYSDSINSTNDNLYRNIRVLKMN